MRKRIIALTAAIVLLGGSLPITAAIVELPLDCAGTYDPDNQYWTTDFDLGVTFLEISHVYIDWAGQITGGLGIEYSNPDEPFPLDVSIKAYLDMPVDAGASIWGGGGTYPNPEPFDYQLDFELFGLGSWSDLLDGQGTIWLFYERLIIVEGGYIESGSVVLDEANLIVEGVIPEPSSLILLALGSLISREYLNKGGNYNIIESR